MSNMSYCRHENTAQELADVWERWDDFEPGDATSYELRGRIQILDIVNEMSQGIDLDADIEALKQFLAEAKERGD